MYLSLSIEVQLFVCAPLSLRIENGNKTEIQIVADFITSDIIRSLDHDLTKINCGENSPLESSQQSYRIFFIK